MIYPLSVLYEDPAQLRWHFENWYLRTPVLIFPALLVTVTIAHWVMRKVFPSAGRAARANEL